MTWVDDPGDRKKARSYLTLKTAWSGSEWSQWAMINIGRRIRFTCAHELFHAVQYAMMIFKAAFTLMIIPDLDRGSA